MNKSEYLNKLTNELGHMPYGDVKDIIQSIEEHFDEGLSEGRSEEEIASIVSFYDYLEIQPTGNNEFMIDSSKYHISSIEDIRECNLKYKKEEDEFKTNTYDRVEGDYIYTYTEKLTRKKNL